MHCLANPIEISEITLHFRQMYASELREKKPGPRLSTVSLKPP